MPFGQSSFKNERYIILLIFYLSMIVTTQNRKKKKKKQPKSNKYPSQIWANTEFCKVLYHPSSCSDERLKFHRNP